MCIVLQMTCFSESEQQAKLPKTELVYVPDVIVDVKSENPLKRAQLRVCLLSQCAFGIILRVLAEPSGLKPESNSSNNLSSPFHGDFSFFHTLGRFASDLWMSIGIPQGSALFPPSIKLATGI